MTCINIRPALFLLVALGACSKGGSETKAAADSSKPMVASDTGARASDVTITDAQAARIHVATVGASSFRGAVQTTGTVAFNGDQSTQVLAPVSGPITKILVNPGDNVRRGEALATVTSPDFATALASYRKAQSAYRNLQRIAEQDSLLFKNDAIARREMEQAQTDAQGAAADRDAAIEQMKALGVDDDAITAVREGKSTSNPLAAVIRAPIAGTVVEKLVNPGQLITAGTTACFTIADLSTVWVMANVFESDLGAVAQGEDATITTAAQTSPIQGHVVYVGSLVDPSSKATAVRILASNPRDILKRDALVNVSIKASHERSGILIAASAVLRDDQNLPYVYVSLPKNRYARRSIVINSRIGDQYEIQSGLSAGDRVVVDGALFIQFAGSQ